LNWSKWSSKAKRILDLGDLLATQTSPKEEGAIDGHSQHLSIAKESLEYLLEDKRVPDNVRESLNDDYNQVQHMLDKLKNEHIHISVLGRVSVGKSSLLNVLMGNTKFSVSPLHGETKKPEFSGWDEYHSGNIFLIDTPGINEIDGLAREKMALEVVSRSDIILFVVDGDITDTEYQTLKNITTGVQPVVLVLNKTDRYTKKEKELLLSSLTQRVAGFIQSEHIVSCSAQKSLKHFIQVDEQGNETEFSRETEADVSQLKSLLRDILAREGKTLAALNAVLFAEKLSQQVTSRLMEIQKKTAEKLIHTYCIAKGVAVAVNPVPVADLMAAALIDAGMILHLSKVYGFPLTTAEAGDLVKTIMSQIIILMGSIWAMNLLSSALKLGSVGLSTFVTASAQGAVAYYGTYVVGQAADYYFKHGKSWGKMGPKQAVKKILDSIDRDSVIASAKEDIMVKIKAS
jgi:GTPase